MNSNTGKKLISLTLVIQFAVFCMVLLAVATLTTATLYLLTIIFLYA